MRGEGQESFPQNSHGDQGSPEATELAEGALQGPEGPGAAELAKGAIREDTNHTGNFDDDKSFDLKDWAIIAVRTRIRQIQLRTHDDEGRARFSDEPWLFDSTQTEFIDEGHQTFISLGHKSCPRRGPYDVILQRRQHGTAPGYD